MNNEHCAFGDKCVPHCPAPECYQLCCNIMKCTCMDYQKGHICKHIHKVMQLYSKNIRSEILLLMQVRVILMSRKTEQVEEHHCDMDVLTEITEETSSSETLVTQFGSNPSKERQNRGQNAASIILF